MLNSRTKTFEMCRETQNLFTDFLESPSIFIRLRMMKENSILLSDEYAGFLNSQKRAARVRKDYKLIQFYSEKLYIIDRCRNGDIETAIFGKAHQVDPRMFSDIPEFYSDILKSVDHSRYPIENSKKIQILITLLERIHRDCYPLLWAELQQKLCVLYLAQSIQNHSDAIKNATQCCYSALHEYQRDVIPLEWARAQSYLALAFKNSNPNSIRDNEEASVFHFNESLSVYTQNKCLLEAAANRMNLAAVYLKKKTGDRAENIEQSINLLHQAVPVYSKRDFPISWAKTRINLALAYKNRLIGSRIDNLRESIRWNRSALEILHKDTTPTDWVQAQSNLANAYIDPVNSIQSRNVVKAIHHYKLALETLTKETSPLRWARVNANLAVAFRAKHHHKSLELSIIHAKNALEVFTKEISPYEMATTQKNLALALINRKAGHSIENDDNAKKLLRSALELVSPECYPRERLEILIALSEIHLKYGEWSLAIPIFEEIKTMDRMVRIQDVTHVSEHHRIRVTGMVYSLAAYCCAQAGLIAQSLEWLELGKLQLYRDRINLDKRVLESIPAEDRIRIESLSENLRYLNAEQQNEELRTRPLFLIAEETRNCRDELNALIERITLYQPDFLSRGLSYREMTERLDPLGQCAFMVFTVTKFGSAAIVLSGTPQKPILHHAVYKNFKNQNLNDLTRRFIQLQSDQQTYRDHELPPPHQIKQYYQELKHLLDQWNRDLIRLLCDLFDLMFRDVFEILLSSHADRLILITQKELNILPLHLACKHDNDRIMYLIDYFEVSQSPSFNFVSRESHSIRINENAPFLGVSDTTGDLTWTTKEVEEIGQFFANKKTINADASNYETIVVDANQFEVIHFCCHGIFDRMYPYNSRLIMASGNAKEHTRTTGTESIECDHTTKSRIDKKNTLDTVSSDPSITLRHILRDLKLKERTLIVLSTCESGLSEFESLPDEFIGLSGGFLLAGANTVLSSLWSVPDESTCLLMTEFYRNLIRGQMTPSQALINAQQSIRKIENFREPLYWGAFKIIGG